MNKKGATGALFLRHALTHLPCLLHPTDQGTPRKSVLPISTPLCRRMAYAVVT